MFIIYFVPTNTHIFSVPDVAVLLLFMLFTLILKRIYLGGICLVLHILLDHMEEFILIILALYIFIDIYFCFVEPLLFLRAYLSFVLFIICFVPTKLTCFFFVYVILFCLHYLVFLGSHHQAINSSAPKDVYIYIYIYHNAQLTSRRCILNIHSTNIIT